MNIPIEQSSEIRAKPRFNDRQIIGIVLLVALVNGFIYAFLAPPWQHYDEPNHFEYVWLVANRMRLLEPGDYDPSMSRAVYESMINNKFYGARTPEIPPIDQDIIIPGYTQLDEPPVYYLLAALPVMLVRARDVSLQLHVARLISVGLFLLTVLSAWGITCEITHPRHPLRWMVPLSLALLPGFVDLMTAVNNDVGAIAFFSFFLWGSTRLIQRGIKPMELAWVLGAAVICGLTKITALVAIALLPFVILLALAQKRLRVLFWGLIGLTLLIFLGVSFSWGDAAAWGRNTFQKLNTSTNQLDAPLGEAAFQIEIPAGAQSEWDYQLHQVLNLPDGSTLEDKEITIGAWMWASRPLVANAPVFNSMNGFQSIRKPVQLSKTPQFVVYSFKVDGDGSRNWLSLMPVTGPLQESTIIYYDGIVLLEGNWLDNQVPSFDDLSGRTGTWSGRPFINLIRNASAEISGIRLRPEVDRAGVRVLPDRGANMPSIILYYLIDTPATWPYQRGVFINVFQTYWARFGWGHIPLPWERLYSILLLFTVIGMVGAIFGIYRLRRRLPWATIGFLIFTGFIIWLETLVRGANYVVQLRAIYYPVARYVYPVIIPTMLAINLGWYEVGRILAARLRLSKGWLVSSYITGWFLFNLYGLYSIASFYYGI